MLYIVLQNILSVLVGGIVTLWVSRYYFKRQESEHKNWISEARSQANLGLQLSTLLHIDLSYRLGRRVWEGKDPLTGATVEYSFEEVKKAVTDSMELPRLDYLDNSQK